MAANDSVSEGLWIDAERHQIQLGDRIELLKGAWDAAFLACLASPDDSEPRPALDVQAMGAALAAFGLRRPLAPTEWGRILDRIHDKLTKITAGRSVRIRVSHGARQKTRGPWRLESSVPVARRDSLQTSLGTAKAEPNYERAVPDAASFALARQDDLMAPVRLADRLKQAMEMLWKALPAQATLLLAHGEAWRQESPAVGVLRQLRWAETLRDLGHLDDASNLLDQLGEAMQPKALRAVFLPHVTLAKLRLDYARHPINNHNRVLASLQMDLTAFWSDGVSRVDATAWAELFHLSALCQRRCIEATPDLSNRDAMALIKSMMQAFQAAFLLFMLVRNHERAQHVCANTAYAHQKLAARLGAPHWDLAVAWHALSFSMHTSFGGAESSAWEYIYIGELWLSSADARAAFQRRLLQAGWNDHSPDQAQFYEEACRIADQLGDPRQQAYTLLNRFRFHASGRNPALRRAALKALQHFLRTHPVQHQLLLDEGYPVPRLDVPA